ncbi:MAG: Asp-tRNA(Asn)/Glu-tRNA(Gln) amidotransferase subunit GatA [Planctomycetaceae bacterium]|nr:Asp-tRNA(Asn)/Glu-tRNA(Gln) amidotransferase subunit GatA [Planctomycetaceae bacterium]
MAEKSNLTVAERISLFRSGRSSVVESTRETLRNITEKNPSLNAFIEVWSEEAIRNAELLDRKRTSGEPWGPLFGVPIAMKDNMCVAGRICSCASQMLANYRPTYGATVSERLVAADAILIGRTNMDEFAMGSGTEYSIFGKTRNPYGGIEVDTAPAGYSPGGSSGGSAVAVAAGMVPLALGSDTGGSIRQPAAFCGVFGLKPTYGRVSRFGLIAFGSSLDQIGPFANCPDDLELLFQVIAGHDRRDATSLSNTSLEHAKTKTPDKPLSEMRIGVIREHSAQELSPDVRTALEETERHLKSAGAMIVEVSLPKQEHAIATYYIIAACEAASNLSRYDGMHFGHRAQRREASESLESVIAASRGEGFGPEVKRRILLGTYALSHGYAEQYYQQATRMRQAIREDFAAAFAGVDLLLGPTTPAPAFAIGAHSQDPVAMYLTDQFTVSANLAGLPAMSIPIKLEPLNSADSTLPVAIQMHAPPCGESRLFAAARSLHSRNQMIETGAMT